MKNIRIYTDGASSAKDNIGGWAALIIYPNNVEVELFGHYVGATNNQMELLAVIEGLSYIFDNENCNQISVEVISDSEYVVNGISSWLPRWIKSGWKSKGGPVKNKPLWEALHSLVTVIPTKFTWTRGHSGDIYNERVDKLAVAARLKK